MLPLRVTVKAPMWDGCVPGSAARGAEAVTLTIGSATLIASGLLVVDWPLLSVATAVMEYVPVPTFVQSKLKGALLSSPSLVGPSKNSTFTTEPSESSAAAAIVMLAGVVNTEP